MAATGLYTGEQGMSEIFGFIMGLIKFAIVIAILLGIVALLGYNALRALSENIREAWSNIGVVSKKQASLVNQLIDVVKGYQESEKLVMLKVSDDLNSTTQVAQLHQQTSSIIAAANGLAQRFPDLKADQQYQRLIDSIQQCEVDLENARGRYNHHVKLYNVKRNSIPHVFYAGVIGFKTAPYLEFLGTEQTMDTETIRSFSSDADGERLNALLGQAGAKVKDAGSKALSSGKLVAGAASEKIRQLAAEKSAVAQADEGEGEDEARPQG